MIGVTKSKFNRYDLFNNLLNQLKLSDKSYTNHEAAVDPAYTAKLMNYLQYLANK